MGRLSLLGFLSLSVLAGVSWAGDEPRTHIEKGIAAAGGSDKSFAEAAIIARVKGVMFQPLDGVTFTGSVASEPGGRSKMTLDIEAAGGRLKLIHCLQGARGWKSTNGTVEDLTDEEVKEMSLSAHVDLVMNLVPVLKDKEFKLEPLAEEQIEGKAAKGVKVSREGKPDVSLFFSPETGLLVKYSYREKHPTTGKEALHETVLSDYREVDLAKIDEDALKAAKVAVDGASLIEFLKKHVPKKTDEDKIKVLIKALGAETFADREKASEDLIALGPVAVPLLRQASKNPDDPEVATRAGTCLKAIGDRTGAAGLIPAAIRVVGFRKPNGAAQVLLDFASLASDVETSREARSALFAVSASDKTSNPALVEALNDKDPNRRAVAEAVLGKDGGKARKEVGLRLFPDGVKLPMKALHFIDGQKTLERETVELQFFNRLEDSVFARPQ